MSTKAWTITIIVILVLIALYFIFRKKAVVAPPTPVIKTPVVPPAGSSPANPSGLPPQVTTTSVFPLHQGSHGFEVQELQTYLNTLGENLATDGVFGNATLQALKARTGRTTVDKTYFNDYVLGNKEGTSGSVNYNADGSPKVCNWYDPTTWTGNVLTGVCL